VQGNLLLMYQLQQWLKEISGFAGSACSRRPARTANWWRADHPRLSPIARRHKAHAHHHPRLGPRHQPRHLGHGGFDVVNVKTDSERQCRPECAARLCDDRLAGLMLTNPNTLGLFEQNILEVVEMSTRPAGWSTAMAPT
jgi:glycine dehydrogenase subunit 2